MRPTLVVLGTVVILFALQHGLAGVVLTVIVLFFTYRFMVRARAFVGTVGGRRIVVRTEGGHGTKLAAHHESGHIAVTRAVGGRVLCAHIYPDGSGVTYLKLPANTSAIDRIAVDVAGEVAAGSNEGCESDQTYMRAVLNRLPAHEREAARDAGYARARGVLGGFWSDGGAQDAAATLLRDGRL